MSHDSGCHGVPAGAAPPRTRGQLAARPGTHVLAFLGRLAAPVLLGAVLATAAASHAAEPFRALDRTQAAALANPAGHPVPTIVALWSAECVHCKKNLALFAAMARKMPGIRLVTVATDELGVATAAPLDRLGASGPRFAYGDEAPEALAYALDAKWRGELPRTLLFDGRGGRTALSGVLNEPEVRRALGLSGE